PRPAHRALTRMVLASTPQRRQTAANQPIPRRMPKSLLTLLVALSLSSPLLASPPREMAVRATAYNSLPGQGMGNPSIGAWGDRLKPGMKAIAVSRDLLNEGLLGHRSVVRIEGLPGE